MNHTETVQLIAYLDRAGLVQALDGQAAVWTDALDDVAYADAHQVARRLVRERTSRDRWVTPGDIRAGVRELHAAQPAEHAIDWEIDADPDDPEAYLAAVREGRRRPAFADAHARPVDQLVAQTANHLPAP